MVRRLERMELIDTRRWRTARKRHLARSPLCVKCLAAGQSVAATEVDHIRPHKGDPVLFWDPTNWQSLCKPCHSKKTTTQDGGFGLQRRWTKRPKRWVICGPPGVGKTTWVMERMRRGDLTWDLDAVAAAVAGAGLAPRPPYLVNLCLALRDAMTTWCSRELHCGLYVICSDRQAAEQLAINLGAELVELTATPAELATRLANRSRSAPAWHWP